MEDCLFEATDLARWIEVLDKIEKREIELIARETREPSPFSHERLNARPYAFLDDAPLEERRARAVSHRRTTSPASYDNLATLDPAAIEQASTEVWPQPRSADEMMDVLRSWIVLPDLVRQADPNAADWWKWLDQCRQQGRVSTFDDARKKYWVSHESWPVARAVYSQAQVDRPIQLPPSLDQNVESMAGRTTLIKGWMETLGPVTAVGLAAKLGLAADAVQRSLEMIEAEGAILRGHFTPGNHELEWCDRRTLARIHRYTQAGFRRRLEPVEPTVFLVALFEHHGLRWSDRSTPPNTGGAMGLTPIIHRLAGFEASAGAWETELFAARFRTTTPLGLINSLGLAKSDGVGFNLPPAPRRIRTKSGASVFREFSHLHLPARVSSLAFADRSTKCRGPRARRCSRRMGDTS